MPRQQWLPHSRLRTSTCDYRVWRGRGARAPMGMHLVETTRALRAQQRLHRPPREQCAPPSSNQHCHAPPSRSTTGAHSCSGLDRWLLACRTCFATLQCSMDGSAHKSSVVFSITHSAGGCPGAGAAPCAARAALLADGCRPLRLHQPCRVLAGHRDGGAALQHITCMACPPRACVCDSHFTVPLRM